jgi:hypothetical protein
MNKTFLLVDRKPFKTKISNLLQKTQNKFEQFEQYDSIGKHSFVKIFN